MRRTLALLCLLSSGACTRSSDPRLYTLVPARGSASYASTGTVEVRRPTIAGYLDRREIVRAVLSERLELASDANWAEPLDAMFGRVLAADLALRLPNSQVFTDLNTLGAVSNSRIDLELQRFEQGPDGLVLRALVALRRGSLSAPVAIEAIELKDSTTHRNTEAAVGAMNALLAQLSDRIAAMLDQPVAAEPR
ncbi:MAG: hypothetical protein JWN04_3817 [Myxococcaceae bacterium]|nr:hypothetical protein [Myxococcaceae bacterium]